MIYLCYLAVELVCWWAGVRLWCWLVTGAEGASYCLALTLSRWLLQHRRKCLLGWRQQTLSWCERPVFLSYFLFSPVFVSRGCFWVYCAVQSFALNLKYWKEIKSDSGIIVLDMLSCLMKIWSLFLNVIAIFCLNFVLVWCSETPVAFS